MKAQKRKNMMLALLLVLALCASGVTALATGITFEALQQTDENMPLYLPKSVELKKMSLPLVVPQGGALLYVAPEAEANAFMGVGADYPLRYLGTEGDFYHVLTFQNKEGYIKKGEAKRESRELTYPVYPAGTYPVGRELTPGVETVDEARQSVSYNAGEMRPYSEVALNANTGYYVRPTSGKTAKVTISNDAAGKDVVKTFSFKGRAIIDAENGQYVTIENAVAYHAALSPSSLLKKYIEANQDVYGPGEGRPASDPSLGISTDDLLIVTFM